MVFSNDFKFFVQEFYSIFDLQKGIPGFGFTPFNNTPVLLHDHNEFLNDKVFLKGLDIMYKVVLDLANMI